jgi:hypothetical protein
MCLYSAHLQCHNGSFAAGHVSKPQVGGCHHHLIPWHFAQVEAQLAEEALQQQEQGLGAEEGHPGLSATAAAAEEGVATPASSSSRPGSAAQGTADADAGNVPEGEEGQQAAAGGATSDEMAAETGADIAAEDADMADEDAGEDEADWGTADDADGGASCPAGSDEVTYDSDWSDEQVAEAARRVPDEQVGALPARMSLCSVYMRCSHRWLPSVMTCTAWQVM